MKKFLALVCMIACVFGLTACGNEETLTGYEQQKVDYAQSLAAQKVLPLMGTFMDETSASAMDDYTAEEIEYMMSNDYQLNVDGNAVITGIDSFYNAKDTVGTIVSTGETKAEIEGDQIVITMDVKGEKKDGQAELIFSNDMFMVLESVSLHPVSTMGDMMGKAAMNTLIGMGTVFIVLILISLIISCFAFIPKLQAKFSGKKEEKEDVKAEGINNAVAQIMEQEESVDETDDLELVAVIAAAIAASEGAVSADGFVVRSVRRVGRSRR